jgi:hypothetical protein
MTFMQTVGVRRQLHRYANQVSTNITHKEPVLIIQSLAIAQLTNFFADAFPYVYSIHATLSHLT